MAFRPVNFAHLSRFNSSVSSELLNLYEDGIEEFLRDKAQELPHRTFAPSSARCQRRSWFRIRGAEPDVPKSVDSALEFTAELGTACHRVIQRNLAAILKERWIDVTSWIQNKKAAGGFPDGYDICAETDPYSGETLIEMTKPFPVRFACDGLVRMNGVVYLLEIKTSEFSSWNELTEEKPQHVAQVEHYCALLGLQHVLYLYQDRQYGGLKCYEHSVSPQRIDEVLASMRYVMDCVDHMVPPPALPAGDSWCAPSMCPYFKKCKEWGR